MHRSHSPGPARSSFGTWIVMIVGMLLLAPAIVFLHAMREDEALSDASRLIGVGQQLRMDTLNGSYLEGSDMKQGDSSARLEAAPVHDDVTLSIPQTSAVAPKQDDWSYMYREVRVRSERQVQVVALLRVQDAVCVAINRILRSSLEVISVDGGRIASNAWLARLPDYAGEMLNGCFKNKSDGTYYFYQVISMR